MMAMEDTPARYFRARRRALASTVSTSSTTSGEIRWTPNRDVTCSPSLTTYSWSGPEMMAVRTGTPAGRVFGDANQLERGSRRRSRSVRRALAGRAGTARSARPRERPRIGTHRVRAPAPHPAPGDAGAGQFRSASASPRASIGARAADSAADGRLRSAGHGQRVRADEPADRRSRTPRPLSCS